jgi:hypothetical protein
VLQAGTWTPDQNMRHPLFSPPPFSSCVYLTSFRHASQLANGGKANFLTLFVQKLSFRGTNRGNCLVGRGGMALKTYI